jgi:glyceraldehyde-3-phosphate dehydrogenase (NADP+)
MTAPDIRQRLDALVPRIEDVPSTADFAPGGGVYADGTLYLVDGEVRRWTGGTSEVTSPVCVQTGGRVERRRMGVQASLTKEEALCALEAAARAWDHGRGEWPTMSFGARIERVEAFLAWMRQVREESVRLLMWEIGKTRADSEKEFDRTVQYVADTVEALKEMDRAAGRFSSAAGILAQIRRAPLGVVLCMGPFNYPLNETFTTLIPALIMGNTIVAKLPRYGMLCQAPLLRGFAECFPRGVVNVVNGDGRTVAGPIVESGSIAALAFIGSSRVANVLKKQHPKPNRLRCILGLDAKNPAIVLADADLDLAVAECVTGALSFNGQRCTGLKLLYVHRSIAERFLERLSAAVDALPFGLPWQAGVKLTPLPETDKPAAMQKLVDDAVSKGAKVRNANGGLTRETFYFPSVVYPVDPRMALHSVEQFGPVVPVAPFEDVSEVVRDVVASDFGQQASIFGRDARVVGPLVDVLANQVCRVNLNAQCQRGPDVYPFTGRKDSAEATLSVSDALRCFSIRSMVAAPAGEANQQLLRQVLNERTSNFVNTDYLF